MKKRVFATLLAIVMLSCTSIASAANVQDTTGAVSAEYSEFEVTPRADVIVTKFRVHKGVMQYRRWNETEGYWVDPAWIDLE